MSDPHDRDPASSVSSKSGHAWPVSWDLIIAEINQLSGSYRLTAWIKAGVQREDVCQDAALVILKKLSREPTVRELFRDNNRRRAYLFSTLYYVARTHSIRSWRWSGSTADVSDVTDQACGHPDEPLVDLVELLKEVLCDVHPGTNEWLASRVLSGLETLDEYARSNKLSERTARRHLGIGLIQLRALVRNRLGR